MKIRNKKFKSLTYIKLKKSKIRLNKYINSIIKKNLLRYFNNFTNILKM